jgi:hypothetical protein
MCQCLYVSNGDNVYVQIATSQSHQQQQQSSTSMPPRASLVDDDTSDRDDDNDSKTDRPLPIKRIYPLPTDDAHCVVTNDNVLPTCIATFYVVIAGRSMALGEDRKEKPGMYNLHQPSTITITITWLIIESCLHCDTEDNLM